MTTPAPRSPEAPTPAEADPQLGPVLDALTECLCATLADAGRAACACCLVWGAAPPAQDFCGCTCDGGHGQAWVRVVRWEPVSQGATGGRCAVWRMEVTVELGVARCVAVVGPDGKSPPSCEQREDDAWGALADARLLRQAVACCSALKSIYITSTPGPVTPLGPQGGCAGVAMQITMEV